MGSRFCNQCGTALGKTCPKCAVENAHDAKFCSQCGALLESTSDRIDSQSLEHVSAGERRHLTVLFCDLVGSTEIAAQLDPEEWRDVVAGYHRTAAEAITRYGGHVAKYLGDGIMAYFGWPEAQDNDGERAVRAGLAILEAISKLNDKSPRPKLTARLGIDSGPVVVGAGAGKEADVFGDAPNIAARLQATAAPGTVLITAATHRLISGLFVVEALGPRALKGITTSLEVFQVVRPTGVHGRLQAARGFTPFVGREEELRVLLSRWERTREGEGQVALIIGEPGIGKSRLVAEFHDRIRDTPHIWMESAGEQFFENTPFHAIVEMLSRWLELQDAANPEEQFKRVERALASAGLMVAEIAPLIGDLLQLPVGERYSTSNFTAEQKRRRLLGALSGWILGAAKLQPLVMVVEDLHWLDPSTLELQQLLAEQGATAPLMLLYTARPEFHAPWPTRTHHTQITLNRLSPRTVRQMVSLVAANNALASESVDAVVERTGGVPLFVEEVTRAVLESSSGRIPGHEIPATLRDSLMARLDRLGPAKEVIQIGAVIGNDFSYGLLEAVHPIPEQDLQGAIRRATDAELVYVMGIPPDAEYQFKHALIRDAAYEALLRSRRKEIHSRIAEVLVGKFPDRVTSAPELLAHHYTEAGFIEEAIPYWQRAGENAARRSANLEAANHVSTALKLLHSLPNTPDHLQQELDLRLILGPVTVAIKGYGAEDVLLTYTRIVELCQQMGETPRLLAALYGLWSFYGARADYKRVRELAQQLLNLAERQQDQPWLVIGHWTLGCSLFYTGKFYEAHGHFQEALKLHEPRLHQSLAHEYGYDAAVACLSLSALELWLVGYPESALCTSLRAIDYARSLAHPFSLGFALAFAAWLHHYRRDLEAVLSITKDLLNLSREQSFPYWEMIAEILRGWALAETEEREAGISLIREGIDNWRATGAETNRPFYLALLALACAKGEDTSQALSVIAQAFDCAHRTGESFHEAELYRIRAELILKSSSNQHSVSHAEQYLLNALEVARQQKAKSLELRAATTLGNLWLGYGKAADAYKLIAETYRWFTEGFDSPDLKEAKALLEELSK